MAKYELIDTISLQNKNITLHTQHLPELVHLDDSAFTVMTDFTQHKPRTISPLTSMNDALNEMKMCGVHILLVATEEQEITGLISTEDLLGAKPIKIIQQRRIDRTQITVKMLMTPIEQTTSLCLRSIRYAKVGNVVETLKNSNTHYALVIDDEHNDSSYHLCGMFSTWQISRQLHMDLADKIEKAQGVAELQKRHSK